MQRLNWKVGLAMLAIATGIAGFATPRLFAAAEDAKVTKVVELANQLKGLVKVTDLNKAEVNQDKTKDKVIVAKVTKGKGTINDKHLLKHNSDQLYLLLKNLHLRQCLKT